MFISVYEQDDDTVAYLVPTEEDKQGRSARRSDGINLQSGPGCPGSVFDAVFTEPLAVGGALDEPRDVEPEHRALHLSEGLWSRNVR